MQLPGNAEIPKEIDRLVLINGRILRQKGGHYLELATSSEALHRQFYQFATAVADRILLEGEAPLAAAVAEVKCFDELLAPRALLSSERQLGLLGELIVLERLIVSRGPAGADAWTGPRSEPHDFRIGQNEFEVKASSGTRRLHRIHGLDQMFPSTGMRLSLVSVLLEPAGKAEGFSLASKIAKIRGLLSKDSPRLDRFASNLNDLGWRDSDSRHYARLWRSRRPIAVIPVNGDFPRLGRPSIVSVLGTVASRIDYVEYQVNVEGLGLEEDAAGFPSDLRSAENERHHG
ncbi:MAG TPA: PD-(D/E)XK motif protein [Opitutaceae bacterium]|nr:PD-(D/E)XK motif protein [Opitutaceae bacterium]